jgi:hypothetical protein
MLIMVSGVSKREVQNCQYRHVRDSTDNDISTVVSCQLEGGVVCRVFILKDDSYRYE